jgi:transcription-repair coupling factor (superfamily II helicase)
MLQAAELRILCEEIGVMQLDRKREFLQLRFTEQASVDAERLMQAVARKARRGAQFTPQGVLKYPLTATDPSGVMEEARALISSLRAETAAA